MFVLLAQDGGLVAVYLNGDTGGHGPSQLSGHTTHCCASRWWWEVVAKASSESCGQKRPS